MPIVKRNGSNIIVKDGKVSCECCAVADPCITSASSPAFSDYTNWIEITLDQYVALFGSGTWSLAASTSYSFSATITDELGTDPWSGSSVGSGSTSFSTGSGCLASATLNFGTGTATSEWLIGTSTWGYNIVFTRRLGTNDGKYYLTFGGFGDNFFGLTRLRSTNPMGKSVFATVNVPVTTAYTGTSPTQNQVTSTSYGDTAIFKLGGTNLSSIALNVRIDTAGQGAYPYNYSNPPPPVGMIDITESGSSIYTFDFTPDAP